MLRQVLVPSKENSTVAIPDEYIGQEIEVIIFPTEMEIEEEKVWKGLTPGMENPLHIENFRKIPREELYDRC